MLKGAMLVNLISSVVLLLLIVSYCH